MSILNPASECRVCRLPRLSPLQMVRGGICTMCSEAGDVARWQAEHEQAKQAQRLLSNEIFGSSGDELESRQGRRLGKQAARARKEEARASFRRVASELIAGVRPPDESTLDSLADARNRAAFRKREQEEERWFRVFLAGRLSESSITIEELEEVLAVLASMTGLDELAGPLENLNVDIAIALANAGEMPPIEISEELMFLAPGEEALFAVDAELWEPVSVQVSATSRAGFTFPLAPGAQVGVEQAHTVTTERPGDFQPVTEGVVVVTTRRTVFVNGRTINVPHSDLLRIGAERHLCLLHHTGTPSPVVFQVPDAAAAVAASMSMARRNQPD